MDTLSMVHVLVVEDSVTTRRFLVELINSIPWLMVVGEADNGEQAIRMTKQLRPDVISMDIQMPHMNGLEATQIIMSQHPTPIVLVSSGLGQREIDTAMLAMESGALAAVEKPTASPHDEDKRMEFLRMLRLMAGVRVIRRRGEQTPISLEMATPPAIQPDPNTHPEIVVIGASAGGPGALSQFLQQLPQDFPLPIVIAQHLSRDFVPGLASWLDRRTPLTVRLALEGAIPRAGQVWLAPGSQHIAMGHDHRVVLYTEKGAYTHQPSIDILFHSTAEVYGAQSIGILMTGMGTDGAEGMAALYNQGARTIVQDQESCVVFGMPAAAIESGAVEYVLPLTSIASAVIELAGHSPLAKR